MSFDVTGPSPSQEPRERSPFRGAPPVSEGSRDDMNDAYERQLQSIWEPKAPRLVAARRKVAEETPGLDLGIPSRAPVSPLLLGGIAVGVVGAVLIVMLIGALTGGGGRLAPDEAVPSAVSAGPPVVGAIGQPLRVGTVALKVHDIREVPAGQEEQPAAGMRWVAVDVEVVNEGNDKAEISMLSMFDLEDATGTAYLPTIIGSVARYAEGDLPPGLRLRGDVVFEVPADAGGFTLLITSPDRTRTGRVGLG